MTTILKPRIKSNIVIASSDASRKGLRIEVGSNPVEGYFFPKRK